MRLQPIGVLLTPVCRLLLLPWPLTAAHPWLLLQCQEMLISPFWHAFLLATTQRYCPAS